MGSDPPLGKLLWTTFLLLNRPSVFISHCCCSNLPQTGWLKMAQMCSLTVCRPEVPQSQCSGWCSFWRLRGEHGFLPVTTFRGFWAAQPDSMVTSPSPSCLPLKRLLVVPSGDPGFLPISKGFSSITAAKFTGSGVPDLDIFGGSVLYPQQLVLKLNTHIP